MATSLTTRRLLVRSSRCGIHYWSGASVDRISQHPSFGVANPPPIRMRETLVSHHSIPKKDRSFSTYDSFMERWNTRITRNSSRGFATTSDRDNHHEDTPDEEEEHPTSEEHPKVLLYAVYDHQDFAEIRQRDFVEAPWTNPGATPTPSNADDVSLAVAADVHSLDDIFDKALELFGGTCQNLQYYHSDHAVWYHLRNEEDLDAFQQYCGVVRRRRDPTEPPKVVPIRLPQYYQEADPDDAENDISSQPNPHNLEGTIEFLLYELMTSAWERVEVPEDEVTTTTVWRLRRKLNPDERNSAAEAATDSATTPPPITVEEEQYIYLDTRDWVLQHAAGNSKLRALLVYYPHALEHITECLHYPFLWDNFPRQEDGTPRPVAVLDDNSTRPSSSDAEAEAEKEQLDVPSDASSSEAAPDTAFTKTTPS